MNAPRTPVNFERHIAVIDSILLQYCRLCQDCPTLLGLFICDLFKSQSMSEEVATTYISLSSLDRQLWMQVEGGDDVQQEWLYHITVISLIFLSLG